MEKTPDLTIAEADGVVIKLPVKRLIILTFLSLIAITTAFKFISWQAGYIALLAALLIIFRTLPEKLWRVLLTIYLLFAFTLIGGTLIHDKLLVSDYVQKLAGTNKIVNFVAGGPAERVILSIVLGLFAALLLVGGPLLGTMLVSSEVVLALTETFGVNRRTALRYLWSLIMGIQLPWQIVREGEVKVTKPAGVLGSIGGPGLVIIQPGNAVVFEWGGDVSQIAGAGIVRTKRFERIKEVVDLRRQWRTQKVEEVLTKDRVPLTIWLGVGYHIELKAESDERPESRLEPDGVALSPVIGKEPFLVYERTVHKAVYNVTKGGWMAIVAEAAGTFLRDCMAVYQFDDIYKMPEELEEEVRPQQQVIHEIEREVRDRLARIALKNWGVRVDTVDITRIDMPDEVRDRVLDIWRAAWEQELRLKEAQAEGRALLTVADAEARAIAKLEKVKWQARDELITQVTNALRTLLEDKSVKDDIIIRFCQVVQKLSISIMSDDVTARRYVQVLEALAESEGRKILLIGGDRGALGPGSMGLLGEGVTREE